MYSIVANFSLSIVICFISYGTKLFFFTDWEKVGIKISETKSCGNDNEMGINTEASYDENNR